MAAISSFDWPQPPAAARAQWHHPAGAHQDDAVLAKPFDLGDFLETVAHCSHRC